MGFDFFLHLLFSGLSDWDIPAIWGEEGDAKHP
jgi:hypothetical protein